MGGMAIPQRASAADGVCVADIGYRKVATAREPSSYGRLSSYADYAGTVPLSPPRLRCPTKWGDAESGISRARRSNFANKVFGRERELELAAQRLSAPHMHTY